MSVKTSPVCAMMKPLPKYATEDNRANIRAAQEQEVCNVLADSAYSMSADDIVAAYSNLESFPGFDSQVARFHGVRVHVKKLVCNTCRRLEQKGTVISVLIRGKRIYSLPVENGGAN